MPNGISKSECMNEEERFESLVDVAREVEEHALDHVAYSGPLDIKRVIDLSPDKYASMNYDDLLNNCDRISKVIKASQLDIYSSGSKKEPVVKKTDIEQNIRNITTESITAAEQMSKEIKKAPEIKTPEKVEFEFEQPLEVEHMPEEKEFAFEEIEKPVEEKEVEKPEIAEEEKPKQEEFEKLEMEKTEEPSVLEIEKEVKAQEEKIEAPELPAESKGEKRELKPLQRALQRMRERKAGIIKPETPPILSAPEAPKNVFEEIRSTFNSEWGEERDEEKIKRKMIELTKELFREKTSSKREEIKRQITVLKNMLAEEPIKGKKTVKKEEQQYSSGLFSALSGTLDSDFASKMNFFSSDAEKKINVAKETFQNSLVDIPEDDSEAKKGALDKLVFELTGIGEKANADMDAFLEEVFKKHISAIEQFEQSTEDKLSREKAGEKKEELESKYNKEIELLKSSVHTRINAMIEDSSRGLIVSERKETKKEKEQAEVSAIINEIAEMDEGSLLFYLHSQDLNAYKNFEHKRISRQEAINIARKLMATEKGLGDAEINKHWGVI